MLQIKEFSEAAGLGFEPRLTDPESVSTLSWLFTAVQKTASSSQISGTGVSCCSPLFTPVTVKSLSNCPPTRDSQRHKSRLAAQPPCL
jgi:hypothetical protein